jgi:hypothetical protein
MAFLPSTIYVYTLEHLVNVFVDRVERLGV